MGKCSVNHGFLIPPKPSAPTVILRHNPASNHFARSLTKVGLVPQHGFRIAHVLDLHYCTELAEPNERIGLQAALTPQLLHLRRSVDVVNLPVRTFQHQVASPGSFLFTVHQDPAVDGRKIPNIQRRHRKPVIGQQCSVCCQGFLPIGRSLHCSKHLLRIAPHKPACSAGRFGQAHPVKDGEACGFVLGAQASRLAQSGFSRIPNNFEVLWPEIPAGIRRFPHDPTIERCNLDSEISRRSASAASSCVRYPSCLVHRFSATLRIPCWMYSRLMRKAAPSLLRPRTTTCACECSVL